MTIYEAWQKAYQDLKAFFNNDAVALYQYIDTDNYSQITIDYRPDDCYANVFGGLWTFCDATPQGAATGNICDELDAQMFTMFQTWAEADLRKQFETAFEQYGQCDAPDVNTFKLDDSGKQKVFKMDGLDLISTYILANASDSLIIDVRDYLRGQGELSAATPKLVRLGDYLAEVGLYDTGCYYMAILPDGQVAGVSQALGELVDDWDEFARLVRDNNLWGALDIAPIAEVVMY